MVAVRNHVGIMQIHEGLAAQHRLLGHAIKEELAHELFLALAEMNLGLERLVVQHVFGEAQHVEYDVEAAIFRPRQNIFRILQIHRENRGGKTELKI